MPYIQNEDRAALEPTSTREAMSAGELAFQLTCIVDGYLAGNMNFQAISEVIAALECSKLELYRRIAAPYEDMKQDLNGEVYTAKVRLGTMRKVGT